jgi:hypothetical protein
MIKITLTTTTVWWSVEENVNNDDAVLIMGHSLKVKAERKFPAFLSRSSNFATLPCFDIKSAIIFENMKILSRNHKIIIFLRVQLFWAQFATKFPQKCNQKRIYSKFKSEVKK